MLLDEMNLARVEHYFSDWLSCTESRREIEDGTIIQHPVALHRSEKPMEARLFESDGSFTNVPVPPSLELPTNLVVTGTVNVDETTYGFSPKVLDRSMVIEFDDVDLNELRGASGGSTGDAFRFPDVLPPFRLATAEDYAALPQGTHSHLSAINDILEDARLHFGYNSLQFDEHLLRQAFYKSLHPPYLTNTNRNSRSDALRMVQAASLFAPNALTFPVGDDGQFIFKLDQVAPLNGFAHNHAHDALADVEATIFLCRTIVEKAPDLWSAFMRFGQKAAVADHISSEPVFSLSDFYFGNPYSWLVSTIGSNTENNSEFYVYDLSIDPETL